MLSVLKMLMSVWMGKPVLKGGVWALGLRPVSCETVTLRIEEAGHPPKAQAPGPRASP